MASFTCVYHKSFCVANGTSSNDRDKVCIKNYGYNVLGSVGRIEKVSILTEKKSILPSLEPVVEVSML